ncbi:MAG TPA: DNA-directed RNA polymerase subunit beta', partial [Candidatus Aminicenantes bacterium]|nr:DNA-directed RNA polymerase subunit beta' [Candidatus Aminicenantes bacterium]
IALWNKATDKIREEMFAGLRTMSYEGDSINPIFVMSDSGARGSKEQLKQLAGMRGLMAKPSGDILETPIKANFKEGLSVLEYFISTHGARKGLADTALKTADAGYLTRKLVDAAVEIIVKEDDCGTLGGVEVAAIIENGKEIEPLYDRIVGRISLEDIVSPENPEKVIVKAGDEIDEYKGKEIIDSGILRVKIRSVLTCETRAGVCRMCYGRNLSTGAIIELGEAVGIIAAQSIGEPGTQLTMRTFHIGGIVMGGEQTRLQSGYDGIVKFNNLDLIEDKEKTQVVMSRIGSIQILDSRKREKALYPVSYGSKMLVKEGQTVSKGDPLIEWDPFANSILTNENGVVELKDLEENVSYVEDRDEQTSLITKIVIDIKNEKLRDELQPQILVRDKETNKIKRKYYLPVNAHISVKDKDEVAAGDVLAKIPSEHSKTKDITGGLPRVTELFEARKPKFPAKMAQIDGIVEYGKLQKGARKLTIKPFDKNVRPDEHNIPRGSFIIVGDGDKITAGTPLMDGPLNPVDILNVLGEQKLAEYLLKEIQDVYRLQGVEINDKHIEIIIRQMIKWRRIEDVGDTNFIPDQIVEKWKFEEENARVVAENGQPAKAKPALLPISRAALAYDSFISAAAFQETTRVLTDAAIAGKEDILAGIKENVAMGRLIPAGTGYSYYHNLDADEMEGAWKTAR